MASRKLDVRRRVRGDHGERGVGGVCGHGDEGRSVGSAAIAGGGWGQRLATGQKRGQEESVGFRLCERL